MSASEEALANLSLTPLPGSDRAAARDVQPSETRLDPDEPIEVTLVLRRKTPLPDPSWRLNRADFTMAFGADASDVEKVTRRLTALGLSVIEVDQASRRVRVRGTAGVLSRVFGVGLSMVSSTRDAGSGRRITHRHRTGSVSVPSDLADIVTAVLGLDNRPQSRAHLRKASPAAVSTSYTPPQLGTVYDFPADTDGTGQTVAIIELGGGYAQDDLDTYFSELSISTPSVTAVSVDGAENDPDGDPDGPDAEVLLDIEVVGALAPGAQILVYFAPNTDAGFVDAVSQAAHATPTPTAISISWGQSEDQWTAQARTSLDDAMADAVSLGVTVTAAAGDSGSSDAESGSHVDFPASSPHALGCGGTTLEADPSTGQVTSETVWNGGSSGGATGGGVSDVFALPSWQSSVGVPAGKGPGGRGVPDVAADADPQTGYKVRIDGQDTVIGGTSAVAPLWAALIARCAQSLGKGLGLVQSALYDSTAAGKVAAGFRDITSGNNGTYEAGPGWDACTGLGVPDGSAVLSALVSYASGPVGSSSVGSGGSPSPSDPGGDPADPLPA